jgi:hypothetical protein
MPGHAGPAFGWPECKLVLGIHGTLSFPTPLAGLGRVGVDGQDLGERSNAVVRTAVPGHDEGKNEDMT